MGDLIRIPNIQNYLQEIINNELVLTPKDVFLSKNEFSITYLAGSTIINCIIKNDENIISNDKTSYISILIDIWKSMPTQQILQTTTFNMKLDNCDNRGFTWNDDIKLCFQSKDSGGTFKEILNMIEVNNYSIIITIKLHTGRIIKYRE